MSELHISQAFREHQARPILTPYELMANFCWKDELTLKIPSDFLTNSCSFWPTWRNPFLYQKKYENLRK
jgi:hypothetical protein